MQIYDFFLIETNIRFDFIAVHYQPVNNSKSKSNENQLIDNNRKQMFEYVETNSTLECKLVPKQNLATLLLIIKSCKNWFSLTLHSCDYFSLDNNKYNHQIVIKINLYHKVMKY